VDVTGIEPVFQSPVWSCLARPRCLADAKETVDEEPNYFVDGHPPDIVYAIRYLCLLVVRGDDKSHHKT
jgi:hypothetical protein